MKYTLKSTLSEVLLSHPKGAEILKGFGMHCLGCPYSQQETLEQACEVHGLDKELLIQKLNEKK